MESTEELPVSLSHFASTPASCLPSFQNPKAEAPPSACPFQLTVWGLSSLITHQDILALPHFLSSHSCIKNLANKSLLMLYYFFNTLWQILFYCGFLEIILDLKIPRLFGLEMHQLFRLDRHFPPPKFPKQSGFLPCWSWLQTIPLIKSESEKICLLMFCQVSRSISPNSLILGGV